MTRILLAITLTLTGCGLDGRPPAEEHALGEFSSLWLSSYQDDQSGTPEKIRFSIWLSGDRCWAVRDEATVSINGQAMGVLNRGGPQGGFTPGCDAPEFFLESRADQVRGSQRAVVELRDSRGVVRVEVDDFLTIRKMVPRQPLDAVKVGQELLFDWSHPADDLKPKELMLFFNQVINDYHHLPFTLEGGLVRATVPPVPAGRNNLRINVSPTERGVTCTGIPTCTVSIGWGANLPTTIVE